MFQWLEGDVCTVVYQQVWSFCHPIPGVSRTIVFTGEDDEGNTVSLIAVSHLKHVQLDGQTENEQAAGQERHWKQHHQIWSKLAADWDAKNTETQRFVCLTRVTTSMCSSNFTQTLLDLTNQRFLLTVWPEGMCKVFGPGLPMNLFCSLMLANVPLVITASFPLRAPYELNSRGVSLRNIQTYNGVHVSQTWL